MTGVMVRFNSTEDSETDFSKEYGPYQLVQVGAGWLAVLPVDNILAKLETGPDGDASWHVVGDADNDNWYNDFVVYPVEAK